MAWRLVFAFIALSAVRCEDLIQGEDGGNLIYTEYVSASPLIPWSKEEHVYVETEDEDEFISKIVVIDQYPNKPGKVEILEGGIGHEDVLIEFTRSGIFRGLEFHVEIYSKHNKTAPPHKPHIRDHTVVPINVPKTLDITTPASKTPVSDSSSVTNAPVSSEASPIPSETPLTASNVPQVASVVPQEASNVPQVASNVPQDTSNVPQVTSNVPQDTSNVPQDLLNVPRITISPVDASSSSDPSVTSAIPQASIEQGSTLSPFVNSADQTALVGLVLPANANVTRVRRQTEEAKDYDVGNTTEIYDEWDVHGTSGPEVTGDY